MESCIPSPSSHVGDSFDLLLVNEGVDVVAVQELDQKVMLFVQTSIRETIN